MKIGKSLLFILSSCLIVVTARAHETARDTRGHLYQRIHFQSSPFLTGRGVVVAVIDSGVNFTHPDLRDNAWLNPTSGLPGWNFLQNSPTVKDELGHGTAAAGVISSKIGIAPESQIMNLQITDADGVGSEKALTEAIQYALQNKAAIINISMSMSLDQLMALKQKVGRISFEKSLFVVSAGNYAREFPRPHHLRNVLFVGATTLSEKGPVQRARYSCFGQGVDIGAPAGNIMGNFTLNAQWPQSLYRNFNGTSSAAPVVAGVAALKWQQRPDLSAVELKNLILQTADKTLSGIFLNGNVLNAGALLAAP